MKEGAKTPAQLHAERQCFVQKARLWGLWTLDFGDGPEKTYCNKPILMQF